MGGPMADQIHEPETELATIPRWVRTANRNARAESMPLFKRTLCKSGFGKWKDSWSRQMTFRYPEAVR